MSLVSRSDQRHHMVVLAEQNLLEVSWSITRATLDFRSSGSATSCRPASWTERQPHRRSATMRTGALALRADAWPWPKPSCAGP